MLPHAGGSVSTAALLLAGVASFVVVYRLAQESNRRSRKGFLTPVPVSRVSRSQKLDSRYKKLLKIYMHKPSIFGYLPPCSATRCGGRPRRSARRRIRIPGHTLLPPQARRPPPRRHRRRRRRRRRRRTRLLTGLLFPPSFRWCGRGRICSCTTRCPRRGIVTFKS